MGAHVGPVAAMKELTLDSAVATLRAGGVIAYPTEAVWGLGCDPSHEAAVHMVLRLKQRPIEKGMILVAAELSQLEGWVRLQAPDVESLRAAGVVRPNGLYVDFGNRRHDQGAVYTPTSITEPMVRRALEPLVFVNDDGHRRLQSAREILGLRVCDPAMGSAAFLVQARTL